jgi:hypothetical protein
MQYYFVYQILYSILSFNFVFCPCPQPKVPVLLRLAEGGGVPLQSLRGRRRGLRDERAGGPPPEGRTAPGGREGGPSRPHGGRLNQICLPYTEA